MLYLPLLEPPALLIALDLFIGVVVALRLRIALLHNGINVLFSSQSRQLYDIMDLVVSLSHVHL